MKKLMISILSLMLALTLTINMSYVQPVNAGAFADFFGIKDDTGGFILDNMIDEGLGRLSDAGQALRISRLRDAMRTFRLRDYFNARTPFGNTSKYFNQRTTKLVQNASRLGRFVKYLGSAAQMLNVYNTGADTIKLISDDSKHGTWVEKGIDKSLGAIDAGMGWYAVGAGAIAILTAPTWGAGVLAAGAVTGTAFVVTKISVGITRIAFNSKTYRDISALVRGEKKLVFAPLNTPGRKEGLDIIKEELGFDLYPDWRREIPDPATGIPVYKPNIYIYSDELEAIEVTVYIEPASWITSSIPVYNPATGWTATVVDGSINGGEGYLFYEAVVPDEDFQREEGHRIDEDETVSDMIDMMFAYGFSEKETTDFVAYWTLQLAQDTSYVFYPQDTMIVEPIMPISLDQPMDHYYRVWFYIVPLIEVMDYDEVVLESIDQFERGDLTLIEWGGMVRK